eukprot:TRINITY_DN9482_c0_g1_i1.p1 TRINITY_DN9482_c0_g1~~TRINITY_DN9482_c0_g1_i1.p1  ORF type:complete len:461 (-),score=75.36 TRINITY_DN9482_c0_g1_i1:212-1594(-)
MSHSEEEEVASVVIEAPDAKKQKMTTSTTKEIGYQDSTTRPVKPKDDQLGHEDIQFLLKRYYESFYPFEEISKWLSSGKETAFSHREISYQYGEGIVERFASFRSWMEFKSRTVEKMPSKIDFGAVYNIQPCLRQTNAEHFHFQEKELVFDIDMDDYNDIRRCCDQSSAGSICTKCWVFMTAAIKTLDHILQKHFGFKHVLFVFSGRRGVHCWVSDRKARNMTQEQRKKIMSYFSLMQMSSSAMKSETTYRTVFDREMHPLFEEIVFEILEPLFSSHVLRDQQLLDCKENWTNVISSIGNQVLQDQISMTWSTSSLSPVQKWEQLKMTLKENAAKFKLPTDAIVASIIVRHTYPRFDVKVSESSEHLLKSPFCAHPKTGKICIPIEPRKCASFDPNKVMTVADLMNEVNLYDAANPESSVKEYAKTSLAGPIQYFSAFTQRLLEASRREQIATSSMSMDF